MRCLPLFFNELAAEMYLDDMFDVRRDKGDYELLITDYLVREKGE